MFVETKGVGRERKERERVALPLLSLEIANLVPSSTYICKKFFLNEEVGN